MPYCRFTHRACHALKARASVSYHLEQNKRDLVQQGLLLYCKERDQRNFAKGKNPGGGKLESLLSKAWRK